MGEQPSGSAGNLDLFRYLAADEKADYIAIMSRFTSSLLADMSAPTVSNQLGDAGYCLDPEVVEARCRQLVKWGNLVPSLRDARVSTVAEYLRARSRYQVTSLGGRVHRGALEIMDATDGAREVARELLGQIAEAIGQIPALLDPPVRQPQADRLAGIVTTIFNNQQLFTASVTDFYAYLSGVLSRFDLATDEYAEFKGLLLDYVDLITADVNRHSPLIASALNVVLARIDELLDVLSGVAGLDLGNVAIENVAVEHSRRRTRTEWEQLRHWYTGAGDESGPAQLRAAAGQALGQLIANAKRMLDVSTTGFSRRADLLRLAAWFETSSDHTAHQLYAAAFGAYSSRHLLLGAEEPDTRIGPSTSWLDAPPIVVPVSLRERGDRVARGRVSRVPDHTADRRRIEAAAARDAELNRAAAAELSAAGALEGARLSPAARDLLLTELANLLALQVDSGYASQPADHDAGLVLHAEPGADTVIAATDGTLTVHGYRLTVDPLDEAIAPMRLAQ